MYPDWSENAVRNLMLIIIWAIYVTVIPYFIISLAKEIKRAIIFLYYAISKLCKTSKSIR
jgi:hypothetical protein